MFVVYSSKIKELAADVHHLDFRSGTDGMNASLKNNSHNMCDFRRLPVYYLRCSYCDDV
jgi:hypothetical protein